MDLRKTLISVLWILLLKQVEDCQAEEGMWKYEFLSFFFFHGWDVAAAGGGGRQTDVRGGDSLASALVL